jgi:hypothetical protein
MREGSSNSQIPITPWRYFIQVSKPFKWWVAGAIASAVLASALSASTSYFFKLIVDAFVEG